MTFSMVMVTTGAVNFTKTDFIGAGSSRRDKTLQMPNVCFRLGNWQLEHITLVKGGPEYTKLSHVYFFDNFIPIGQISSNFDAKLL